MDRERERERGRERERAALHAIIRPPALFDVDCQVLEVVVVLDHERQHDLHDSADVHRPMVLESAGHVILTEVEVCHQLHDLVAVQVDSRHLPQVRASGSTFHPRDERGRKRLDERETRER